MGDHMQKELPHPLSDAQINEFWPDSDHAEIRQQFDALMAQMAKTPRRSFPSHPALFAEIATEKVRQLPDRIRELKDALAGLPEHWRQWQWKSDTKTVFGERYVRSVYGDNGHGKGRQIIATVPANKHYFGTLSDFIAAANPDTIVLLLSRIEELEAMLEGERSDADG